MDIKAIKNLDFSQFTNKEILEYFNGRCQICGSTWNVSNHHLTYRSQGGHSGPRIPLCGNCHTGGKKSIHGDPDFKRKYEPKLYKIAATFYYLKMQGTLC